MSNAKQQTFEQFGAEVNTDTENKDAFPERDFGSIDASDRTDVMGESIEQLTESVVDEIMHGQETDRFNDVMDTLKTVSKYSYNNKLLIRMQRPDVIGPFHSYDDWVNKFGRVPEKGSDAIFIRYPAGMTTFCADCEQPTSVCNPIESDECEPENPDSNSDNPRNANTFKSNPSYFRFGNTFAYSQTVELPDDEKPDNVSDISAIMDRQADSDLSDGEIETMFNSLVSLCESNNVSVDVITDPSEWNGTAGGFYSPTNSEIQIRGFKGDNPDDERQRIKQLSTLIHEVAHSIMHNDVGGIVYNEDDLDSETMELEAEAVTKLVCDQLDIETDSGVYIATHLRRICDTTDRETVKNKVEDSFRRVDKATTMILTTLIE